MKKSFFVLFSLILSFSFIFSGCNLFIRDPITVANQTAVEAGDITLTREEFLRGYSNYYNTFYRNSNGNSEKAMSDLIEYLISKKLYIRDAEELIESGEIVLTDVEKNYLWYSTYTALMTNIKSFEEKVKVELGIEKDEEDDDLEREEKFVYTPYTKLAEVVYNSETNQYEILIIKNVMIEKINSETGENEYEYVSQSEAVKYPFSGVLFDMDYIKDLIKINKLFKGKEELTSEENVSKEISKEAIRRYIVQLKENEKGKDLSIDDEEVYNREIERIYKVIYENLLINKLYKYKSEGIEISEELVLEAYLEKVKQSYERYLLDDEQFSTELTTTVGSAKYWAGYSTESECVEDIFYVPDSDEEFFFVTHIVIKLSEYQVQQINDLKRECEDNGYSEEYYQTEFNKIIDKTKIKLDERDKDGYIVVKSTDEDAITLDEMLTNLANDLEAIDDEFDELDGNIDGEVKIKDLSDKDYFAYVHARADKFNEYIYKYSDDEGTLQIQKSITGTTNENWYVYGLGTGDTDAGFVSQFLEGARNLHEKGSLAGTELIVMESWKTTDGVETLQVGSTGYSMIMYCGGVVNLFENFDEKKFGLQDLFDQELKEEGNEINAKYYSLLKMDYQRLGLTMNKTLFDLVFEEVYNNVYQDIIQVYEDSILKDIKIKTFKNVYSDLIK